MNGSLVADRINSAVVLEGARRARPFLISQGPGLADRDRHDRLDQRVQSSQVGGSRHTRRRDR